MFRRGEGETTERMVTTPGRVIFNSAIEGALQAQLSQSIDGKVYTWENKTLAKREIGDVISGLVDAYGPGQVAPVLDAVKDLGFIYATRAGVTVSKNDIVTPPRKGEILEGFELQVDADPRPLAAGPDHRGRAQGEGRRDLGSRDRGGRRRDDEADAQAEPHLHDGDLRCPRKLQADPPAGGHARSHGESEGRDHRAPDQGQLHGRPLGPRVLHLDARCPQGTRGHRAAHRRLGLPHAAPRRRVAGHDRARGGLRHRALDRDRDPADQPPEPLARRPRRGRARRARPTAA